MSTNGLVVWQPDLNQTAELYCVVCQVSNSVRPIRLSLAQQIRMYTITDIAVHTSQDIDFSLYGNKS